MFSQASFLTDLVADLYSRYYRSPSKLTIVFPNARSGEAFEQCLAAQIPQSTWKPKVTSIDTFLQQSSPLKQAQPLLLTHILYETFQLLKPQEESFEQFYFWGSLLLEDFDVIDKYLVDANHLFTDLSQQKELSLSYDYLTEAQQAAIQSFWKNFKQRLSTHQQVFLRLWKLLPQVYQHFKRRLYAQGIGYQGLCYSSAYEALAQGTVQPQHNQLVFAGFNALMPVEEKVMMWYQAHLPTSFYWDVDAYYMEDTQQEAGLYLRAHQQKTAFQASFSKPFPSRIATGDQEIHITEVASEVGQVQVMRGQLHTLMKQAGDNFILSKVAVVVANESLHTPVLHALSYLDKVPINTNLGYPLKHTIAYWFLESLLMLRIATTQEKNPLGYFITRRVLAVLNHPFVIGWNPTQVQATIDRLKVSKQSYVAQEILVQENPLYATLFKMLGPQDRLLDYLIEALQCIETYVQAEGIVLRSIEKIALEQILQQLGRLQALLPMPSTNYEALLQLLRQLIQNIQLPRDNQSAGGIQVLDVLTTQNLDFDYVFIVGMNEGHFPAQNAPSSFIPYNLRKGYGLPTVDQHQAALYAYHFYRLLQRAQRVHITYSTQNAAGNPGEMSRYLWQILYESKLRLKKHVAVQPIHLTKVQPINILKKDAVLDQLNQFILQLDGQAKPLTPSALNTYLDCSLRFYFQYLVKLEAPERPQRATHALVFGNLFHVIMEKIYTPLMNKQRGQPLQTQDLAALHKKIAVVVEDVFAGTLYSEQRSLLGFEGDHTIAQTVMKKLIHKVLALDQMYAPFVLIGIEVGRKKPLYFDFQLDLKRSVRLQGIIDRVDWKAGVFRVLDYKTGLDKNKIKDIATLFDRTARKRNKAAFQTFFYAWLFQQQGQHHVPAWPLTPGQPDRSLKEVSIMPGLFNTRQLFDDQFDPRFFLQQPGSRTHLPVENMIDYQEKWEQELHRVLLELLDPAVPFSQTDDEARCISCPYKGICQRN